MDEVIDCVCGSEMHVIAHQVGRSRAYHLLNTDRHDDSKSGMVIEMLCKQAPIQLATGRLVAIYTLYQAIQVHRLEPKQFGSVASTFLQYEIATMLFNRAACVAPTSLVSIARYALLIEKARC